MLITLLYLISATQADYLDSIETEIHEIKNSIEETLILLSNTVKKAQDLNLDTRYLIEKSNKSALKIKRSSDVSQYIDFTNELQTKNSLIESKLKTFEGNLNSKPISINLEATTDKHIKHRARGQDLQQSLSLVEDQLEILKSTTESIYDVSYLSYALLGSSLGLILTWKNISISKKKHYL